eukprot:11030992-Lingulodinium_polyedra.AAC.1
MPMFRSSWIACSSNVICVATSVCRGGGPSGCVATSVCWRERTVGLSLARPLHGALPRLGWYAAGLGRVRLAARG